jgi:hypothetical protein
MKYYYLINGKIMSANEKMPTPNTRAFYTVCLNEWKHDLQPCEISDGELTKINQYLFDDGREYIANQIEVTDIISDNNGVISFKDKNCLCLKCSPIEFPDFRFNVCSICGNKRCPHASDHNYKCTNSNEPNQFGSVYCEHPKQVEEIEAENKYHFAREILFTLKSNQSITETAYLYWIDKLIQDEKIFKNQK